MPNFLQNHILCIIFHLREHLRAKRERERERGRESNINNHKGSHTNSINTSNIIDKHKEHTVPNKQFTNVSLRSTVALMQPVVLCAINTIAFPSSIQYYCFHKGILSNLLCCTLILIKIITINKYPTSFQTWKYMLKTILPTNILNSGK